LRRAGNDQVIALADLPAWAFSFVLVLCRCGAATMQMPGVGEAEAPMMFRAGLTAALVLLVLPVVGQVAPADGWTSAMMVGSELLCGGVLGWLARCIALALPMAGQIISFMLGLSSVISADPALGQSSALMRLFSIAVPVLVLQTGLWALPIAALSGSYELVPPGHLIPVADSSEAALNAVSEAFGLALRLAAPFVIAGTVWQIALGLVSRLIPQLQIYFAAMPGQIFGGLVLFGLLSAGMVGAWLEVARTSLSALPGLP
jgi:flagellar biosynthetic protein FliR